MQVFKDEAEFEEAVIKLLPEKGWKSDVLRYPSEQDLIDNWAAILFQNNRDRDTLNDYPLTEGEMGQIIQKINELKTPLELNGLINGKTIGIIRDNKKDTLHYGKSVYLKIYDREEIAGGRSNYQIVQQPRFNMPESIYPARRGDLMLLINGMPLIHIELKKSGIPYSEACNQIQKYHHEGVFRGIFALVQVFVAMNPDDGVYFANPGNYQNFNPLFYFHWADAERNEPYHNWKDIVSHLLNIPMAHQLIGFYTVADRTDGIFKVMRSYQYYAANAISDKVAKTDWDKPDWGKTDQMGGYVWHTTGSGKTMTSFKSAMLIASSNKADKVVFLLDRIELGNQTFLDYKGFADSDISVNDTKYTWNLVSKLKSTDNQDKLIVTSIQKMSRIKDEEDGRYADDLAKMQSKHIVFIIDECHRDVFGDMLITIKNTFSRALFFGFTGTPIFDENKKKDNMTVDVFGDELHRYTITNGITDKNVLGFDPYRVCTFKDSKIKEVIALEKAKAKTIEEVFADEKKKKIFNDIINSSTIKMAGYTDENGNYIKGFEDYLPDSQYRTEEHQNAVVKDIKDNWLVKSNNKMFHAILATSSISEAIQYYRLIKKEIPEMKITALFDPNIDNSGTPALDKEDGLKEILEDYDKMYRQPYDMTTHALFKKDVSARLSHKDPYLLIRNTPEEQLDLLIVVNQMLTGFDSKWLNTLYIDKELKYEGIIQAFSRTNRVYREEAKPFGIIRYYRRPYTMEKRIYEAFELYSGSKPIGIFVEKIEENIKKMNSLYGDMKKLFPKKDGEPDFSEPPELPADRGQFIKLFNQFTATLESAKVQGFNWEQKIYETVHKEPDKEEYTTTVEMEMKKDAYTALLQRYKDLSKSHKPGPDGGTDEVPYDLKGYIVETDTGKIDADYMNSNFTKFIKAREQSESAQVVEEARNALHKSFATLSKEEQLYANVFLHDIERGDITIESDKSFRDYITQYMQTAKDAEINKVVETLGVDEGMLREFLKVKVTEATIDVYSRFTKLVATTDLNKAAAYFARKTGETVSPFTANRMNDALLRKFVLSGGFDIDEPEEGEKK